MNPKNTIKQIAEFHRKYETEILIDKIKNKANHLKSPKEALFFILSYAFYQGRRDELSEKFQKRAEKVLDKFLSESNVFSLVVSRELKKKELLIKYEEIGDLLKQGGVNKESDRLMVVSLINFIQSKEEKNIVNFIIDRIKSKRMPEAYRELDSIFSIGSKIASLILRDVVYIYQLELCLNAEDYCYLQPVDTWVHQICKKLKLIERDKIYQDEPREITNICLDSGTNPIHFNQGVWYLGTHSLEILLSNIDKILSK